MERNSKIISETDIKKNGKSLESSVLKHSFLWGIIIVITAMTVGHLWEHNGGPKWNLLWFAAVFIGFALEHVLFKHDKRLCEGYITSVFKYNLRILIAFCCVFVITVMLSVCFIDYYHAELISTYIISSFIIILGFSSCITGYLMYNRPVILTGFISGTMGSILSLIADGSYKMIVLAGVAFITLVVPFCIKRIFKI